MKRLGLRLVVTLGTLALLAASSRAQTPRVYTATYVEVPPIIDGMETSEDEWAAAAPGGDQWLLLTSRSPETSNNRFDAVWNDAGLYVRQQVDANDWEVRGVDQWDTFYENLNLYFDPNTDGEPNGNTDVFGTTIDGYQLAINQPLGGSEITQRHTRRVCIARRTSTPYTATREHHFRVLPACR